MIYLKQSLLQAFYAKKVLLRSLDTPEIKTISFLNSFLKVEMTLAGASMNERA